MLAFHRAGKVDCNQRARQAPRLPRQPFSEFELACGLATLAFLIVCVAYTAWRWVA